MLLPILAIIAGLAILIWSADKFVEGASGIAVHFGLPPLLIGMVIVGFGTSAPELTVSTISALQNNPGIALGNAYGSNVANIGLILGITAIVSPIATHSKILKTELPVLTGITLVSIILLWDLELTRVEAVIALGLFAAIMSWQVWQGFRESSDPLGDEFAHELGARPSTLGRSFAWLVLGLVLLIASSRTMVWGAVEIAHALGVSDLVIGLTIVAIGTSLPELASSISAVRKGEHDIALGNVLGSNLFNTLAVVGLAGVINPFVTQKEILTRDFPVMLVFTLSLFAICYRRHGQGRINRYEGALLLLAFVGYNAWIYFTA